MKVIRRRRSDICCDFQQITNGWWQYNLIQDMNQAVRETDDSNSWLTIPSLHMHLMYHSVDYDLPVFSIDTFLNGDSIGVGNAR